ncbi:MAG: autoinducer binding domain-containing protein [Acidovorax sp.]
MQVWMEQLSAFASLGADANVDHSFKKLEAVVHALGFEYCAYGLRFPLPAAEPRTVMLNSYPPAWQQRYAEAGYIKTDPTVRHGLRSRAPLVWNDKAFASSPALWSEAWEAGLRVGWAQSSLDSHGACGMLTVVRGGEPLSEAELGEKELLLRGLANMAHLTLSDVLRRELAPLRMSALTARELEVLRWQATGKTTAEIAEILGVVVDTVKFHTRRATTKLGASNRTSAAVRASLLGLLEAED